MDVMHSYEKPSDYQRKARLARSCAMGGKDAVSEVQGVRGSWIDLGWVFFGNRAKRTMKSPPAEASRAHAPGILQLEEEAEERIFDYLITSRTI